jgi:hypothetical protein
MAHEGRSRGRYREASWGAHRYSQLVRSGSTRICSI